MRLVRLFTAAIAVGGGAVLLARLLRNMRKIDFANRCVVITGGSRGLGLVLAHEFARRGAHLALLARDDIELTKARQELRSYGRDVRTLICDVRDQTDVNYAINRVMEYYGQIDVLVNNAGVIQVGPMEHMQLEDYENAMQVHFWGPLYTTLAAIPHMRRQGGGRIVNISSFGGKVAVPHLLPYSASKFALVGLSDGMRAELAKDNILVTTVCPGLMRTGSHINAMFKGQHRDEFAWFAISNALPLASIDARRAAQQIVDACSRGDPQLIITPQAKVAVLAQALFPDLVAIGTDIANRLLPGVTSSQGDRLQTGWQSQSGLAPSVLTSLADRATALYNGLRGARPERELPRSGADGHPRHVKM